MFCVAGRSQYVNASIYRCPRSVGGEDVSWLGVVVYRHGG